MNALTKSLQRSRAVVSQAQTEALQMKRSGPMVSQMDSGNNYGLQGMGRYRNRYSLFRGWLYSAINALATAGGMQPVNVGRLSGSSEKRSVPEKKAVLFDRLKMTKSMESKAANLELEILKDHEWNRVLEQPNPIQSRSQFTYMFISNLCLTGWGFIVGNESTDGKIEFYALPTSWIVPCGSKEEGRFAKFRIRNPKDPGAWAGTEPLDRSQVGFAHLPDPSNPASAFSPTDAQIMAIRIDDHIQTSQERFFENGIFPSVLVTVGKDPHPDVPGEGLRPRLTAAQRRQVHGAIKKVMGGVGNYGNPGIIDGLIERIDRLSATSNEMGWEKSESKARNRILSVYGVNPFILGEPMNIGGYAQAAVIQSIFYKRVNGYLDMLGQVMTNFASNQTSERLLVWWEKCEADDPALRWQNLREARRNEDISQNEFRALLGLPPDEDRNESRINRQAVGSITQLLQQVGSGLIAPDQAAGVLTGMGLPDELAVRIAGTGKQQQEQEATDVLEEAVSVLRLSPKRIAGYLANEVKK